ncbi:hypothetical protein K438DRAFT_1783589 [Mycena galopus ATCC 62051]|nr:hypothetical protein K438DRAFT_1783589 [Mycena galopus ATCC 62051]
MLPQHTFPITVISMTGENRVSCRMEGRKSQEERYSRNPKVAPRAVGLALDVELPDRLASHSPKKKKKLSGMQINGDSEGRCDALPRVSRQKRKASVHDAHVKLEPTLAHAVEEVPGEERNVNSDRGQVKPNEDFIKPRLQPQGDAQNETRRRGDQNRASDSTGSPLDAGTTRSSCPQPRRVVHPARFQNAIDAVLARDDVSGKENRVTGEYQSEVHALTIMTFFIPDDDDVVPDPHAEFGSAGVTVEDVQMFSSMTFS